jgi:hypothetical protein
VSEVEREIAFTARDAPRDPASSTGVLNAQCPAGYRRDYHRDTAGIPRDAAGVSRDAAGVSRDAAGISRDAAGV